MIFGKDKPTIGKANWIIAQIEAMIIRPIIASIMVFRAFSRAALSPPEVNH